MNIFAWLMLAVWPLAKKILSSMGIGVLVYSSLQPLVNSLVTNATSAYGGMTGTAASIIGLAGGGEVISILGGALTARLSFMVFERFGKVST